MTPDIAKQDLRQTAFHEAGHYVVAEYFGCNPQAVVWDRKERSITNKSFGGTTQFRATTPFKSSVIGWAGLLAEDLGWETDLNDWEPDANETYWAFHELQEASETDAQFILGHRQNWRSCKLAADILTKKRNRLAEVAGMLIRKYGT